MQWEFGQDLWYFKTWRCALQYWPSASVAECEWQSSCRCFLLVMVSSAEYLSERTMIIVHEMCSSIPMRDWKVSLFTCIFEMCVCVCVYKNDRTNISLLVLPSSQWINSSHQPWTYEELGSIQKNEKRARERKRACHTDVKKWRILRRLRPPITTSPTSNATISTHKGGLSTMNMKVMNYCIILKELSE